MSTATTPAPPCPPAPRPAPGPGGSTPAVLALLGVTAVWGSTFVLLKGVLARVPVGDFLALRFLLAAAVLTLAVPRAVRRLHRAQVRRAALLGLVYGGAQVLQTVGLRTTSASVSGFLTGLYVVLTPVLGAVLLRRRAGWPVWVATALATGGLAVLALHGLSLGAGEALTLASALLYALHVLGLGVWSREGGALGMTVVQLWLVTGVCGLAALPGGLQVPSRAGDLAVLVYMALVAGALALLLQTWAQARLAPERAAVVMTMEPVWAGAFAVIVGGEVLGPRVVVGGALVLAGMHLAERAPARGTAPSR